VRGEEEDRVARSWKQTRLDGDVVYAYFGEQGEVEVSRQDPSSEPYVGERSWGEIAGIWTLFALGGAFTGFVAIWVHNLVELIWNLAR